jgi:hypothetical protein
MPLSGLNRTSARPRGGVASVELIPASEYAGGVPPAGSAWAFREDRARYSEELTGEKPLVPAVRHILELEFPSDAASRLRVAELERVAASEGVVAVVAMASGERIVVGYSRRFAAADPLHVINKRVDTGLVPGDFPIIAVTLESVDADASKARELINN